MKKLLLFILIIVGAFLGCTAETEAPAGNDYSTESIETMQGDRLPQEKQDKSQKEPLIDATWDISVQNISNDEYVPYSFPHKQPIFDFSVLSKDIFPRGEWTINKLIEKYGIPNEVGAYYVPHYYFVGVDVHFSGFSVHFQKESPHGFSFYYEGFLEEAYFFEDPLHKYPLPLNEQDMNYESVILGLQFEDQNILFPYNIKIGQSTKTQIMDLYPKHAAYQYKNEEYETDLVSYAYAFRNEEGNLPDYYNNMAEGSINYYFDENEVLKSVGIQWFYSDV